MTQYKHRHREQYKGVRIDIRARTSKELQDKVARKKSQIDRSMVAKDTLLLDFGMRYLEAYKRPTVSPEWYDGLVIILKNHIVDGIGNKMISRIKPIEIQDMLNTRDVSKDYIGKIYNLTCQIFHHAYKNGLTPIDYSEDFERPKGRPTQAGRSLTDREQSALLKVLEGHRLELLCKLMLFCGLRTGEARALTWRDVDLKRNVIHIRGTKTANAQRVVPIPAHFVQDLKVHKGSPFDSVCNLSKQQAEKGWRYVKRLVNIEMGCRVYRNKILPPYPLQEPCRLYDLRHTYCTNLEKQGVPISIASRLMGHANISITAKIYTHENDISLELARSLIDGQNYGQISGVNR